MASLTYSILRSNTFRKALNTIEEKIPAIRAWHRYEYEQHFARTTGNARMFRGVYPNFEAAVRAIPVGARSGWNSPEIADRHAAEIGHVWPSDYPVIFWTSRLLREPARIFDLGGNVGLEYYTFQKYFEYPSGLEWTVCDVAPVVELGRSLAATKDAKGLSFTTRIADADGTDILIASGVLQFLETPLSVSLSELASRPRHLVINRVPLIESGEFVTLHNLGRIICPYRIQNRDEFIRAFVDLGYHLIDSWRAPEFTCDIPEYPEKRVRAYNGMYFELKPT